MQPVKQRRRPRPDSHEKLIDDRNARARAFRGMWRMGESMVTIAAIFHVSRQWVWKEIQRIETEGLTDGRDGQDDPADQ